MSVTGLKIVSIYDPITGTVVQMNDISPEGSFVFEPQTQENLHGSNVYCEDYAKFDFSCFNDEAYEQLYTWMTANTLVCAVTYGLDTHLLWYEPVPVIVKKQLGFKVGGKNAFTVTMQVKGTDLDITTTQNLAELFGEIDV